MDNHTIKMEKERIGLKSHFSVNQLTISKGENATYLKVHMGNKYKTFTFGKEDINQIENLGYDFQHFRDGSYVVFKKQEI